jgi:hypothetical protein
MKRHVAVGALCFALQVSGADMSNEAYAVRIAADGALTLSRTGMQASQVFQPEFTVLFSKDDPKYASVMERSIAYRVPMWTNASGQTASLFSAADPVTLRATGAVGEGGKARWTFAEHPLLSLEARIELGEQKQEPRITFSFKAKEAGWYSVGFKGAPQVSPGKLLSLWQPLIWQERRFPEKSYLSTDSMCSIPAVLAHTEAGSVGVAVDPAEIPFRVPTHLNSLFGVALRNEAGLAQPMVFAPVLGLGASKMEPGAAFSFAFRLVLHPGDTQDTFTDLAKGLYGFRDYRENATCSLNETLQNMIDYAMNDAFSGWVPDLRGSDYATDVVGTVKNVSALHPLSIALVTDNAEIYRRRALPMAEYLLSREKYLFATRENIKGQSASYSMKGPCAEVSELAALHQMFQGRTEIFRHYAMELHGKPRALNLDMVSEGFSWQNSLALFRLTGDKAHLERAVAGANEYISKRIDTPQTDFSDVHVETGGQFWTDFAPKWIDLLELYEQTGDERHLRAARHGARLFANYVWFQPCIPDGDVVVNKGGKAPMYYVRRISNPQPIPAPEQLVPAWRVAQVGLMPEASTTYLSNPAVLLTHHAAYMLRLAQLSGDAFFHDIARSAVVGRYANFPGYDINLEYTTVYQRPDYPLRPWRELTYNNIYYNHIWPMIAMCMDYLVSDAVVRSKGKIDFPAQYAQGYAYLQSKVYGDRPGTFYGDQNVRLWMPRDLLRTDTIQANYVAARGANDFYVALVNQSREALEVKVTLNPDVVPVNVSREYNVQVWRDNKTAEGTKLRGGTMKVSLNPAGITAVKIEGLSVPAQFQDAIFSAPKPAAGKESFAMQTTDFGKVTSMLLSLSPEMTSAYVWLDATPRTVKSATLHYKSGDKTVTNTDSSYPYEFSIPLRAEDEGFESWVEVVNTGEGTARSEKISLKL